VHRNKQTYHEQCCYFFVPRKEKAVLRDAATEK